METHSSQTDLDENTYLHRELIQDTEEVLKQKSSTAEYRLVYCFIQGNCQKKMIHCSQSVPYTIGLVLSAHIRVPWKTVYCTQGEFLVDSLVGV